jgi:hypothetical protein
LTNPAHVYKVYSKTIGSGCEGAFGTLERPYMKILRRLSMSTTRPICSIIVIASLLTISNFSSVFALSWCDIWWHPAGGDCNWNNPANWGDHCNLDPPQPDESVFISPPWPRLCINGDATCGYLSIMAFSWAGAGDFGVDMYSGTFTCGGGISIGGYGDYDSATFGIPDFTMYSGTVTTPNSYATGLTIGGSSTGYGDTYGRVNMYGGLISVPIIALRFGDVNLFGGTLECTGDANFVLYQNRPENKINVNGGTLKLKGNHATELSNYIANGRIVCIRGGVLAAPVYDGTWTTLTGTNNFNVAWGPTPEVNATNVHYKHSDGNSITLSWQKGDLAKQHDVYFGTSLANVTSATIISAEYKGSRYDANSDPQNWTIAGTFVIGANYYWRVDETNDSNVLAKGLVWKFTTHDGKAYNPKPINGAASLSEPLQLSWTAGDFAASHKVYFTTEQNGGILANPIFPRPTDSRYRGTQTGTTYSLANLAGAFTIVPRTTYWWCVDEVASDGTTPIAWKGPVWSFTASEYVNIDDFEDYNTTDEMRANWETGYSTHCFDCPIEIDPNCDCNGWWPLPKCCYPDPNPNCGYVVGGGGISLVRDAYGKHMQFTYTNNGSNGFYFSEAKRSYKSGTSFTGKGALNPAPAALSINYIGSATNSVYPVYDRMYVALQDTAGNIGIYLNPDANASRVTVWRDWHINLRDINSVGLPYVVRLNDINDFYLGFGVRCNFDSPGGDGNVMFDNIRLEPQTCDPPVIFSADFDGNCYVDMYDLALMTQFWLMDCPASNPCIGVKVPYCPPPNQCVLYDLEYPVVDLNGDDIMDFKDFSILGNEWKTVLLGP